MTYQQVIANNNLQLIALLMFILICGVAISLFIDFLKYLSVRRNINEKQNNSDDTSSDR